MIPGMTSHAAASAPSTGIPFTTSKARYDGRSASMLRGRDYRAVFRSVWADGDTPDSVGLRVQAARLLVPHGAAACHTAGQLLGLPVPPMRHTHLQIGPGDEATTVDGVEVHRLQRPRPTIQTLDGPCQTPLSLWLAIAAHASAARDAADLLDVVVLGDAIVRRGLSPAHLVAAAKATRGRGAAMARAAGELVRDAVDSPPETSVRLALVLAGLPEPAINTVVRWSDGGWLACPDLSYPQWKVAIEYDGAHHRTDARQWAQDIGRQENLQTRGWIVIRVTATDLGRPLTVVTRVANAILVAGGPAFSLRPPKAWWGVFGPPSPGQ